MANGDDLNKTNGRPTADVPKKEYLTRKDVLRVAARLIRDNGYHGTSTRMIADALDCSQSTLFHHIKSKQDMLFEILNGPMEKVYPNLCEICSRDLPASEKLRLAVTNHILSVVEDIEPTAVLLQERDCLKPPFSEILQPTREDYVRTFRRIVEDGIASGEFRRVKPKMATLAILGMCNWLVQWYKADGEESPEAIAEMYADFALQLVRP